MNSDEALHELATAHPLDLSTAAIAEVITQQAARIAELEASKAAADDMFRSLGGEIYELNAKLAALKAQQRGGVVLPEPAEIDRIWREIQDTAMRSPDSPHIRFANALARVNPPRKFRLGDPVRKTKGSQWSGRVVGFYSTEQTPDGYAVESFTEKGSVQIYPGSALEPCEEPGECVAVPVEPHNIAQQVREALDRKACPDAWMVVAYEATVRAILAQQGKED